MNKDVNVSYILFYVSLLSLNGICVAWTTGGNNQTANLVAAKLGWNAEETRFYNTAINLSS
jgi:hypothetical protein